MNIRKSEIFRYLGYKNMPHDYQTELLVDEVLEHLLNELKPKSIYREFSLEIKDDKIIIDGENGFEIKSDNLRKNLNNCKSVILFSATLGLKADTIIQKYELTSMAKATVAQAACTEIIEAYCDEVIDKIKLDMLEKNCYLKPRFSAGYGDFKLEHQRDIFKILDITKNLGVFLNNECLMTPIKSVTAVIGITTQNLNNSLLEKCLNCEKKECDFRSEF